MSIHHAYLVENFSQIICSRSSLPYGELEERLELIESSLTPVSPHIEERLELLESLLSQEQEEQYTRYTRHNKRSASPGPAPAEQVILL